MKYEHICDADAAQQMILDEFLENLKQYDSEVTKTYMVHINNSHSIRVDSLMMMAMVNALIKNRGKL